MRLIDPSPGLANCTVLPCSNLQANIVCAVSDMRAWHRHVAGVGRLRAFTYCWSCAPPQGDGTSYSTYFFWLNGANNTVTQSAVASAGTETQLSGSQGLSYFNGDSPWVDQVTYADVAISSDWAPGEQRTFYLYTNYAEVRPNSLAGYSGM